MIHAIDKRLTDLAQALVNATGKKPNWWGEQCGYPMILLPWLGAHYDGWPWITIAVALAYSVIGAATIIVARDLTLWDMFSKMNQSNPEARHGEVYLWAAITVLVAVTGFSVYGTLLSLAFACEVASSYFHLCEDPPPPRRRTATKLSTQGAP